MFGDVDAEFKARSSEAVIEGLFSIFQPLPYGNSMAPSLFVIPISAICPYISLALSMQSFIFPPLYAGALPFDFLEHITYSD